MRYFKNLVIVIFILASYGDVKAGAIVPRATSITVLKENYKYYAGSQKPDSVEAYFLKDQYPDTVYTKALKIGQLNKKYIDAQVNNNNIIFFVCFYKSPLGSVYKYIAISVKGNILLEASLLDAANKIIEMQRFYQSGAVLSRTQYVQIYKDSKGEKLGDSLWYNPNSKLIKQGKDIVYYGNGSLRIERQYQKGIIKDTTYAEFYPDGKIYKTFTIQGGQLTGIYKAINEKGIVTESELYEHGKIVKTILTNKQINDNKKAFLFGSGKFSPYSDWPAISASNDISLLQSTLEGKGFESQNIYVESDSHIAKTGIIKSFQHFVNSINKGDIAFIHFSGNGAVYRSDTSSSLFIPLYNSRKPEYHGKMTKTVSDSLLQEAIRTYLTQQDLQTFLNELKSKVGPAGQLYLSLDVSHAGYLLSGPDSTKESLNKTTFRGEKNDILFNLAKQTGAPTFIYTASKKDEDDQETFDVTTGQSYGSLTYSLCQNISNPLVENTTELYEAVRDSIAKNLTPQTPGYLSAETQFLFENNEDAVLDKTGVLPAIKLSGNAFVLSVGVSQYYYSGNSQLSFKNSANDAASYTAYFNSQFKDLTTDSGQNKLTSVLLQNQTATKANIEDAINKAIANTKADDYFIFNFSGYCKPLPDSTGKMTTWFVPYGLTDINDDKEIRQKGISLDTLKGLLQFIPANNQLFITEAGATKDFQREFIRALIETSPTIATLSPKNRIFIVPTSSGFDNCNCNNLTIEQGPINYYLTNLNGSLNVFGLFDGGVYADAIKFDLFKTEAGCNDFKTGYFDVFFEKDFINDLKYFLPEDLMKSRGATIMEDDRKTVASSLSNKYALVVGTDNYEGKPDWQNLDNPVYDASEIAASLKNNFGFNVTLLKDAVADSIYEHILEFSKQLKPSDQVIIYIGGHGDYDEKLFDDGFIVCRNSKPVKQDPYRNTYIQYSKLSRMVNRLPAQQVIIVLDVCFGGVFDERVARNKSRDKNETYEDLGTADYFAAKMKLKTRVLLTSGGKNSVPDGLRQHHSPFALRLLAVLATKGGTGKILTSSDLYEYVKKLPSGPLIGSFGDDQSGSEFVLLAK